MATRASRPSARSIQSVASSTADRQPPKQSAKPVSLAKRLLFPNLHHDADLPPLLVSPAARHTLNAELYDFLALALRARLITAVLRALEARLLSVDLSPLVFRDLPTLLAQHVVDFRNAQSKLHTSYASAGASSLPHLFHHLQPHMAVSADGRVDEVYVRTAIDHLLKACLPPEHYEPETERYIVREIILKVLLESVLPKITQPWFIHKLLLDLIGSQADGVTQSEPPDSTRDPSAPAPHKNFSFQALAIFFLSAVQSVSGACLVLLRAYKQARDTIKKVNESAARFPHSPRPSPLPSQPLDAVADSSPAQAAPSFPGALASPPAPSSSSSSSASVDAPPISRNNSSTSTGSAAPPPPSPPPPPDYTHPPLALMLLLLTPPPTPPGGPAYTSASTARAVAHTLALPLTALAPFFARLLPYLLYTYVLCATRVEDMVRLSRRTLFPDGWPGPSPVDPAPEEQAAMREELGGRLLAGIPAPLALLLGPTHEARAYAVDAMLAPLSSQACNAHLAVLVLDLVLLTVFPEMGANLEGVGAEGRTAGGALGTI